MTTHRSFKRLVRARMARTGERYAAARAALLAAAPDRPAEPAPLATSDEKIRARTGRGWEAWFDLLDEWGADEQLHRDVARRVAAELGVHPLAWAAQAVTTSYERARGGRAVGQHADGFTVSASRTIGVPVARLFEAFADPSARAGWLPDGQLHERTATKPTSIRFDWADGQTRVHAVFDAKASERSAVTVAHSRLDGPAAADRAKGYWRAALLVLKARLEAQPAGAGRPGAADRG